MGTNSKALKICPLPNLDEEEDEQPESYSRGGKFSNRNGQPEKLQVIFENENHHNGSVYCIDWSRTSRLIASGSNDRTIKVLVCPDLEADSA